MKRFILGILVLGTMVAVPAMASAQATFTVLVQSAPNQFSPPVVNCVVQDKVVWAWVSPGPIPHSTTSDTAIWNSGLHNAPFRFRRIFLTPGSFPYYCSFHGGPGGLGMSGVINVATRGDFDDDDDGWDPEYRPIRR